MPQELMEFGPRVNRNWLCGIMLVSDSVLTTCSFVLSFSFFFFFSNFSSHMYLISPCNAMVSFVRSLVKFMGFGHVVVIRYSQHTFFQAFRMWHCSTVCVCPVEFVEFGYLSSVPVNFLRPRASHLAEQCMVTYFGMFFAVFLSMHESERRVRFKGALE